MRRPPLSPDDRQLWHQVAKSVRPISGKRADLGTLEHHPVHPHVPIVSLHRLKLAQEERAVAHKPQPLHAPKSLIAQAHGLDAGWDRKLAKGSVEPEMTIDLHGETLDTAHVRLNAGLARAVRQEVRIILLITGRPARDNPRLPPTTRGVIRASVSDWLAHSPWSGHIATVRGAHPRHGGAGAMYVILRRGR